MSKEKQQLSKIVTTALGGVVVGLSSVAAPLAFSQDRVAVEVEEIVVTGSFIRRNPANSSVPIEYLGSDRILDDPSVSVAGVLSKLPATNGNLITQNTDDSGGSSSAGISLRNLGTNATLILLNGQRQPSLGTPTDVNGLIPKVMLEQIEVVKDGASASYGSEAIAGVINFITNKNFDGAKLNVDISKFDAADDPSGSLGVMLGSQGEDTSIVFGIEYSERSLFTTPNRFSESRIEEYGQRSIFGNPSTFLTSMGPRADPLCGSDLLGGVPAAGIPGGPFCSFDLTSERVMVSEQKRVTSFATLNHQISNNVHIELEGGYAFTDQYQQQPRFPFTRGGVLPASSPFNTFGEDVRVFGRLTSNLDSDNNLNLIAETPSKNHTYRTTGKLFADINDTWSMMFGLGYNLVNTTNYGSDTILPRLNDALNCQGGATGDQCYNPFASAYLASPGDAEYNSPELFDWLNAEYSSNAKYSLTSYDLIINGELSNPFASDLIGVAFGVQHRKERALNDFPTVLSNGDLAFFGPSEDYSVSREVNSIFGEFLIPVLDGLEFNFAGRYDDYNTGESTFTPKLSTLWQPSDTLSLRASIGTSFRVAALDQLLGGQGFSNANDPVTNIAFNGVPTVTVANPNLDSEEGLNWNIGVTWNATDNTSFTLDHFSIELDDRIYTEELNGLLAVDPFNARVIRDSSNNITSATLTTQNGGKFETAGFDIGINSEFDVNFGSIYMSLNSSYTYKFDVEDKDGNIVDGVGSYNRLISGVAPLAKVKGNATIGLRTTYGLSLSTILRYTGKVTMDDPGLINNTEEKSWVTADLQLLFELNDAATVSLSVENITDDDPPAVGSSIYTADGLLYDLRGRGVTLSYVTEF